MTLGKMLDPLFEILSCAWLFRVIYGFGDAISPSGLPMVHLRYRQGKCFCIFGAVPGWIMDQIREILTEADVPQAVIKQMKGGRFRFSNSVPDEVRQRIRNLLVSR